MVCIYYQRIGLQIITSVEESICKDTASIDAHNKYLKSVGYDQTIKAYP